MLTYFVSWTYITIVCLAWGNLSINWLAKRLSIRVADIGLPFICLTGISVVATLSFYLSVFFPLNWKIHVLIVLPALFHYFYPVNRNRIKFQLQNAFLGLSVRGYSLLSACLILILLISSHEIIHPDTLAYHAQAIQWMEKFRAVPGLANLQRELGFQSSWFALQAVFTPFGDLVNFFVIPGCILSWYILFVVKKIDTCCLYRETGNSIKSGIEWGWVFLLLYTIGSWTQLRLTAASASPDFAVTLFILSAVYIFCQTDRDPENSTFYFLICSMLSGSVLAIKLSAISIILLPFFVVTYCFYHRRYRIGSWISLIVLVSIIPLLIRNFVASGYILYPSVTPDLFNTDWKMRSSELQSFGHYITAYARYPLRFIDADRMVNIPLFEWIPLWWKHLKFPDQLLLLIILTAAFANLFIPALRKSKMVRSQWLILIVSFSGSLLWFIKAPDPRFGTGFLIVLAYGLIWPIRNIDIMLNKSSIAFFYKGMVWSLTLLIATYSVYRLAIFFKPTEIVYPSGIRKVNYKEYNRGNLKTFIITDTTGCGITPVPCLADSSVKLIPRGQLITDGFKSAGK